MFLKGQNIVLRAMEPSDSDLLYSWENDQALWPVSFTQVPFSRFILEEFVNSAHHDIYTNKQLRLMVNEAGSNKTIGIVDLFEFDPQHNRCGLGIYIHGSFRQKGYALDCIETVKNYCFETLMLKQVHASVNVSNAGSIALFEKAGFIKSAYKKAWQRTSLNHYEDVWFLQCINEGD